jgi:hypothetical protein
MFVRYYVDLPLSMRAAGLALSGSPDAWLPGLADEADAVGSGLLADIGFGPAPLRVSKTVAITTRPQVDMGTKITLPLTWEATGPGGLFPCMEADIELAEMGPSRTQLSLSGRYTPPLGLVGRATDRGVLHRVAEATVKDFLDRVAVRLVSLAGEPIPAET